MSFKQSPTSHPCDTFAQSARHKTTWGNAQEETIAHHLSRGLSEQPRTTLIVCDSSEAAESLEHKLSFCLGNPEYIMHFPDWETLPYDHFSPHQDLISQRLNCLASLPHSTHGIIVTSINSLMQPLPPQSFLERNVLSLTAGQTLDPSELCLQFTKAGYHSTHTVYEHGEFVSRGSIIDVFPMGSKQPVRIDFLGDEIDSLRYFDPETQLSTKTFKRLNLLPAHEYPLDSDGIHTFLDNWHEMFDERHVNSQESMLYQDVKQGIASTGLEYYLPLFFERCYNLLDYLPDDSQIIYDATCLDKSQHYWKDIQQRWEMRRHDRLRPLIPPQELFFSSDQLFAQFKQFLRTQFHAEHIETPSQGQFNLAYAAHPSLYNDAKSSEPLAPLLNYLSDQSSEHHPTQFLLCTYSEGRRVALGDLLREHGVIATSHDNIDDFVLSADHVGICVAPFETGFVHDGLAFISEDLIFEGQSLGYKNVDKSTHQEATLRHINELKVGSPIVHIQHGIGVYQGLTSIDVDGVTAELLLITYANEDKLYVPVSSLHLIHHYQAKESTTVPLDKLGSEQWQKNKRKAVEKIYDVAVELLETYAKREVKEGFQYTLNETEYNAFAKEFKFNETVDQESTIRSVLADMTASTPMDRLVCGDVGFGKTEVAMRAAFIAVNSGKQVAVLVPTTLLAQQHYDNFCDRFANWPIKIGLLSRFNTTKETQTTKDELLAGNVDIVIGTHKLLQPTIKYRNLGLMIVDEEHRFGVRQKELIKSFKAEIDILTLTATPIPRTLNMSLHSIRDLSLMTTPPAKRLSIKTFVHAYDKPLIKEAILRELLRGGQVFFLHNDVKSMPLMVEMLEELIPEARITYAHGQMREKELERIMTDFYHKRSNILVCSTIIETGIDIPSANTIIMNRADKLGLAQLHQLRGRVGRSHHQAYAYMLTPEHGKITKDAEKRLLAIQEASDLGAGFLLAQHDLEIRGAGELLGEEQSGQIQKIGFSLYMELLEETIASIRDGKTPNLDDISNQSCEIKLNIAALIPEAYLNDPHNRLLLYKRISNASSDAELSDLKIEMINRFGLLTPEINQLFSVTAIKLRAIDLGIEKLSGGTRSLSVSFSNNIPFDTLKLIQLVQDDPTTYQFKGSQQVSVKTEAELPEERVKAAEDFLSVLETL